MRKPSDRNSSITPLGEALGKMLDKYSIRKKFSQAELVHRWPEIAGPVIARHTVRVFVKKDTLYIEVNSAPLKSELNLSKNTLLERLKEEMTEVPIARIRIL